ncbi:MAG: hypothetical protein ABR500_09885 [Dermatophilaceae bacterium]
MTRAELERELDCLPREIQAHMESLHYLEDDVSVCPPCLDRCRSAMTPEDLQDHLGRQEEWSRLVSEIAF